MVDPTTTNLVMAQPLRGSDVGTWDTPVNNNTGIIDQAFGGVTTLAMSSGDVILTSSQAQNSIIRLTGTITTNVAVVLTSIYKGWTIDNRIVNSPSSFSARILSSGATITIGVAPGVNDIFYDGTNLQYRNLGRIGEYWDYAGATVPTWVSLCTTPPWLECSGGPFSSVAYPVLCNLLGGTTLPDARGRVRAALDAGTGRLSSAAFNAGFNPNAVGNAGGNQQVQNHTHANTLNDPTHTHSGSIVNGFNGGAGIIGGGGAFGSQVSANVTINNAATGMTITNAAFGNGNSGNVQPTYIGGITMIRAG